MLVEGHINLLDLIITENDYRKISTWKKEKSFAFKSRCREIIIKIFALKNFKWLGPKEKIAPPTPYPHPRQSNALPRRNPAVIASFCSVVVKPLDTPSTGLAQNSSLLQTEICW